MSRFGHAMLRIVLCKPGRPKGIDCLKDIAYHQVISFSALIGNENVSTWKGLTGGYTTSMPIITLTEAIRNYTEAEFRDISSYPMSLTEEQISLFSKLATERFWSYSGDYKFLSNNCSDETLNFLKSLFYDRPEAWDITVNRPDRLVEVLDSKKIITASYLKDIKSAESKGLFFKNKMEFYEKTIEILKAGALIEPTLDLQEYLKTNLSIREKVVDIIETESFTNLPAVVSAMQLERVVLLKKLSALMGKIKKQLDLEAKTSAQNNDHANVQSEKEQPSLMLQIGILPPGEILPFSEYHYGVPSREELDNLIKILKDQKQESAEENDDDAKQDNNRMKEIFDNEFKGIEEIQNLIKRMSQKYKQLRSNQGNTP